MQGGAGRCREAQGGAGRCREVQGGAGRCRQWSEVLGADNNARFGGVQKVRERKKKV